MPLSIPVELSDVARDNLEALVRAGSTPQSLAFRCRLVLRAGDGDMPSDIQIGNELHCDRHTVGTWRKRFLKHGLAGLQDAPRSGRPRAFSPSRPSDGPQHRLQ